jgi:hypothetical protein
MAAMPHSPLKFKPLDRLTHEWSLQGGEPPPLTLRRICDWAVCGAFPQGTFLFPNGEKVDLLDLHRAMRAVAGLGTSINGDHAIELLQRVIVSVAGLEIYCAHISIEPPQSIKTLKSKFRSLFNKPQHLSPPDCLGSAEVVDQLEAKYNAEGAINTLASILKQWQGHQEHNIPEQANERWLCYVNLAESYAELSKDPEIQTRLAALKHEWDNLKLGTADLIALETSQAAKDSGAEPTGRKKRGIGRPAGSGSLERGDIKLAKEMQKGISTGKYLSIAAAAKAFVSKAGGAGTDSSKEKRLTKRYSELYPG